MLWCSEHLVVSETFLYFAYGSNMLTRRLQERTPSARIVGRCFVAGYRLTFDKVSIDGSGKCTLTPTGRPEDRADGVLFRVDHVELPALDRAEGLGNGYRREAIEVTTPGGNQMALTYIATNTRAGLLPYDWYKEFVVRGAMEHGLPASYIDELQLTNSIPDPDINRRTENFARLAASGVE